MTEKSLKILAFAGSSRNDSFNKKLVRIASNFCSDAGLDTTYIDLKFYPLPMYDGDLEEEIVCPENGEKLRQILQSHDGFIISAPEYNSSISGILKNMIDWCSRPRINEPPLVCFKDKVVALLSASPGQLGGLRGLVTLRSILTNIGSIVIPDQFALSAAHEKFTKDGYLINKSDEQMVQQVVNAFVTVVKKLKNT